MPRILLTGCNGLVGQKILALLKERQDYEVLATSLHPEHSSHSFYRFQTLDITNQAQVSQCFSEFLPDIVMHCAAMTQVDLCEQQNEWCWKTNVEGTQILTKNSGKAHFIFLSSDFVYNGEKEGSYRETDPPHPLSVYGKSKWEAEKIVQMLSSWAIVRTTLVYGIAPHMARSNIVLRVRQNLSEGKSLRIAEDQFRTPTLAEDLAYACFQIAALRKTGIFHVAGPDLLSIYDFAKKIAEVFNLNPKLLEPVLTKTLQEPAARPPQTRLCLKKAIRELQYQPHSVLEGLKIVKKQCEDLAANVRYNTHS